MTYLEFVKRLADAGVLLENPLDAAVLGTTLLCLVRAAVKIEAGQETNLEFVNKLLEDERLVNAVDAAVLGTVLL